MRRKIVTVVLLSVMIIILSVFVFSACNSEKTVASIRIVEGSFKENYALDEKLNLSKAKIVVTYTDGTSENKMVTQDMITGFDTSRTTTNAKFTVTYKGASANFYYKVSSSVSIETSFRLSFEVKESTEHSGLDVAVKATGAETVPNGVYAIRFTVAANGGITINTPELKVAEGYKMTTQKLSVSQIVFVLYSSNGYTALENGTILTFKATKPLTTGNLFIQNASISNGEYDFVVPQSSYSLGG